MRSFLLTACVFFASVLLSVLMLEVGVLLFVGEQAKFPRHVVGSTFGVRINEPNATYRHKSADMTVWFKINAQGMRADRDYAYEKPKGVKRIVSLGDSFTVGYEVQVDECFSSIIESELRERGLSVEVLNAGVSGYSNAEALLYLQRELLRYDPDLVMISFFVNDLVDNVRSDLFKLENGRLVTAADSYVPAGHLGNFLNTNVFFNTLSARSNAFVLFKETATRLVKRRMVEQNVANMETAEESPKAQDARGAYERRLTGAIFERIYEITRAHEIPLLIHSIPTLWPNPDRMVDLFPLEEFDVNREGLAYFPAKSVLEPYLDKRPLYHRRSDFHWTPLGHALAGEAIAERIIDDGLLD